MYKLSWYSRVQCSQRDAQPAPLFLISAAIRPNVWPVWVGCRWEGVACVFAGQLGNHYYSIFPHRA